MHSFRPYGRTEKRIARISFYRKAERQPLVLQKNTMNNFTLTKHQNKSNSTKTATKHKSTNDWI